MILIPQYLVALIMLFVALLHYYWSFGGKIWSESVIPSKTNGDKVFVPGAMATFVVATIFLFIGIYFILLHSILNYFCSSWILWVIAGGFILRGIGDFKYVGLFKQISETSFAKNDSRIYTPLVFLLGLLTLIIALQTLQ